MCIHIYIYIYTYLLIHPASGTSSAVCRKMPTGEPIVKSTRGTKLSWCSLPEGYKFDSFQTGSGQTGFSQKCRNIR